MPSLGGQSKSVSTEGGFKLYHLIIMAVMGMMIGAYLQTKFFNATPLVETKTFNAPPVVETKIFNASPVVDQVPLTDMN